jgi:hypothetical protein
LAATAPELAAKVAEEFPTGTVTKEGTVRTVLLSPSTITTPPVGAGPLRLTVHVDEASELSWLGLQLNDVRLSGAADVIVPPVAVVGIGAPVVDVLTAFVTPIVVLVALAEIVTLTTAITPFWMMFVFSAVSRHV